MTTYHFSSNDNSFELNPDEDLEIDIEFHENLQDHFSPQRQQQSQPKKHILSSHNDPFVYNKANIPSTTQVKYQSPLEFYSNHINNISYQSSNGDVKWHKQQNEQNQQNQQNEQNEQNKQNSQHQNTNGIAGHQLSSQNTLFTSTFGSSNLQPIAMVKNSLFSTVQDGLDFTTSRLGYRNDDYNIKKVQDVKNPTSFDPFVSTSPSHHQHISGHIRPDTGTYGVLLSSHDGSEILSQQYNHDHIDLLNEVKGNNTLSTQDITPKSAFYDEMVNSENLLQPSHHHHPFTAHSPQSQNYNSPSLNNQYNHNTSPHTFVNPPHGHLNPAMYKYTNQQQQQQHQQGPASSSHYYHQQQQQQQQQQQSYYPPTSSSLNHLPQSSLTIQQFGDTIHKTPNDAIQVIDFVDLLALSLQHSPSPIYNNVKNNVTTHQNNPSNNNNNTNDIIPFKNDHNKDIHSPRSAADSSKSTLSHFNAVDMAPTPQISLINPNKREGKGEKNSKSVAFRAQSDVNIITNNPPTTPSADYSQLYGECNEVSPHQRRGSTPLSHLGSLSSPSMSNPSQSHHLFDEVVSDQISYNNNNNTKNVMNDTDDANHQDFHDNRVNTNTIHSTNKANRQINTNTRPQSSNTLYHQHHHGNNNNNRHNQKGNHNTSTNIILINTTSSININPNISSQSHAPRTPASPKNIKTYNKRSKGNGSVEKKQIEEKEGGEQKVEMKDGNQISKENNKNNNIVTKKEGAASSPLYYLFYNDDNNAPQPPFNIKSKYGSYTHIVGKNFLHSNTNQQQKSTQRTQQTLSSQQKLAQPSSQQPKHPSHQQINITTSNKTSKYQYVTDFNSHYSNLDDDFVDDSDFDEDIGFFKNNCQNLTFLEKSFKKVHSCCHQIGKVFFSKKFFTLTIITLLAFSFAIAIYTTLSSYPNTDDYTLYRDTNDINNVNRYKKNGHRDVTFINSSPTTPPLTHNMNPDYDDLTRDNPLQIVIVNPVYGDEERSNEMVMVNDSVEQDSVMVNHIVTHEDVNHIVAQEEEQNEIINDIVTHEEQKEIVHHIVDNNNNNIDINIDNNNNIDNGINVDNNSINNINIDNNINVEEKAYIISDRVNEMVNDLHHTHNQDVQDDQDDNYGSNTIMTPLLEQNEGVFISPAEPVPEDEAPPNPISGLFETQSALGTQGTTTTTTAPPRTSKDHHLQGLRNMINHNNNNNNKESSEDARNIDLSTHKEEF